MDAHPEGNAFSVCVKQDYICTVRICKGCEELNISHRSERKSGGQASWPAMDSIHQVRSKPWPSRFRKPQIITWQKHTYSEALTYLNVAYLLFALADLCCWLSCHGDVFNTLDCTYHGRSIPTELKHLASTRSEFETSRLVELSLNIQSWYSMT